jgi:hypothetical protein
MSPSDLHSAYIVDEENRRRPVILPLDELDALLEDLEDLAAVAERREEPSISPTRNCWTTSGKMDSYSITSSFRLPYAMTPRRSLRSTSFAYAGRSIHCSHAERSPLYTSPGAARKCLILPVIRQDGVTDQCQQNHVLAKLCITMSAERRNEQ